MANAQNAVSVLYESLGGLLREIAMSDEIVNSPQLQDTINNAMAFHQELRNAFAEFDAELTATCEILDELTTDERYLVCRPFERNCGKYSIMARNGATPKEIYATARDDGFSRMRAVAALRIAFQMDIGNALVVGKLVDSERPNSSPHSDE